MDNGTDLKTLTDTSVDIGNTFLRLLLGMVVIHEFVFLQLYPRCSSCWMRLLLDSVATDRPRGVEARTQAH